jgi:hypothetical protein
MLDGLKRKVAATAVGALLKSLATSNDTKTTIVGIVAGALLAVPGLKMDALVTGDPVAIAHVVAGLLLAVIGYLATKPGNNGSTSLVGVMAGTLQASSGSVEAITTGLVIAALGYFTNKPVSVPPAGGK